MRGEAGGEGFLEKVTFKLGHEAFSSVAAEERRHPSAVWMGQQCLGPVTRLFKVQKSL